MECGGHYLLLKKKKQTLINYVFFLSVWVNAAWELDFTEAEPLDSRLAEEITGDGLDAFTGLYRSLLPFAAEHRENGEVRPTASQRCGSWAFLSCLENLQSVPRRPQTILGVCAGMLQRQAEV